MRMSLKLSDSLAHWADSLGSVGYSGAEAAVRDSWLTYLPGAGNVDLSTARVPIACTKPRGQLTSVAYARLSLPPGRLE